MITYERYQLTTCFFRHRNSD